MFGKSGLLGFGASHCKIDLSFKSQNSGQPLKTAKVRARGEDPSATEELALYKTHDTVKGEAKVSPLPGRRFEHQGINIQLIGQIELAAEKGQFKDFLCLTRELKGAGELSEIETHPFEFTNVDMLYDSYRGKQARCRYLLRVTIRGRGLTANCIKDFPFWVRNYEMENIPEAQLIKMEVGIEECLHIEFEFEKNWYHLKDMVFGRIFFILVRIKLKYMEIELRRRETVALGTNSRNETEIIGKYEIMDGAPVKGETVPIRMYLTPYDLTPTYENVHNKFTVRYFLNLVLVDEEDRRYFKQQEIRLFRKAEAETKNEGE
eukprot:g2056.t1